MRKRKIAVITGSRAEYGILYWIIKLINANPNLALQLIVTGMHLSPEFGLTVKDIEQDGFPIAERIEMLLSSDSQESISTSMGIGMIGFAKAYSRLKPDILVVNGDRFEILSAVAAALPFGIPIAHIHGGESTEGVIDEVIRHAVTKMSHVHFVATESYKEKIIQMGESSDNIFCFGSPGLDRIYKSQLIDKVELYSELNIPRDKKIGLFTYHPVSFEKDSTGKYMDELLVSVRNFSNIYWVFTLPNADMEGRIIIKKISNFVEKFPEKGKLFISLGQLKYLSLLKIASLMLGNSSSGLIEAPSFKLPVVNIGDRQEGRIRAKNVIDVQECKSNLIIEAINKAVSSKFKSSLNGLRNPYGSGGASYRIVGVLKNLNINKELLKKKFFKITR